VNESESAFILWVVTHANERGHNRYSQEEKTAFIAGYAAAKTATAEPPADWVGEVSREIRSSYCVCGHARDVHACKFTSVQCVVCGCTEFRDPPVHICGECADCLHDGNKCCGCYDNACCRATAERGEG
jgi:hypothetical protein